MTFSFLISIGALGLISINKHNVLFGVLFDSLKNIYINSYDFKQRVKLVRLR